MGFLIWQTSAPGQPVQKQIAFDEIIGLARERAAHAFQPPKAEIPDFLSNLNYDTYRQIQFRHDKALWSRDELPFRLEFYHPGYLYKTPVKLNEFSPTHYQKIPFVEDFFNYGNLKFKSKIPRDVGYAGFRLLYRLNDPNRWDEVASFLGASYFRMLGQGQRYGASARGLALNSGESAPSEEFPRFAEWWIGKPEKDVKTMRLFALLDSESCSGAYDLLVHPGETTFAEINVVLFFRETQNIRTIGMAPLTSMFWFGENSQTRPDDYRPEVHDSDGLLIRGDQDDFTWLPLSNPTALRHQTYPMNNVRGFGLLQRDREFASYQDTFNLYHKAPSVWVETRGNWGEGEVHLVELPTNFEGADNIVAFWNPKDKPKPRQEFRFGYTLQWAMQPDSKFPLYKVLQTRTGLDPGDQAKRQVVIDFGGKELGGKTPEAAVRCGEGAIASNIQVTKNDFNKSWRVFFSLAPQHGHQGPVDIQCALSSGAKAISETWRQSWTPSSSNIAKR